MGTSSSSSDDISIISSFVAFVWTLGPNREGPGSEARGFRFDTTRPWGPARKLIFFWCALVRARMEGDPNALRVPAPDLTLPAVPTACGVDADAR